MQQYLLWITIMMGTSVFGISQANNINIKQSLQVLGMNTLITQKSPITKLQTVFIDNNIIYITNNYKDFMLKPMYNINYTIPINVTNQILVSQRLQQLVPEMIIYKSSKEKYVITVFTDINCNYCHKLHTQIKEYNDLGITVRYLAFPRHGLNSQTGKDMQSIWCMQDNRKIFDQTFHNKINTLKTCSIDIKKHYELGIQLNLQGTPTIVLKNGTIIPGYHMPQEMLAILNAQTIN
ncbi:Thiol:disulfide interchange protein DsbC [Candidatus Profftia lariciata]|uniref:bifunctional protein-disulfide isomerase/oxidoreductase DsbC n=1 Tax=Candidatus Profftia lariciata TaxID=1987921 RepID=UPI001D01001B|nr:bifunctional protein-disulfide isomerase/oxidoreductase DsbC [Candidatus Profftia lariciata]UDG81298.1 Thiol:disulfide interchange protein DsbC [Candidatus Profftia lariciata]